MSSIHDFKPGETFAKGIFSPSFGEVDIYSDMLLVSKGQFAYPSYKYLKNEKVYHGNENGGEIFGKTHEEVSNKIISICEERRDNLNKIIEKLEAKNERSI